MIDLKRHINNTCHIAPLAIFRVLFGLIVALSTLRFWYKGWIEQIYFEPTYFFSYYGFEWVQHPGETGVYILFLLVFLASIGVALGKWYRISALVLFLSFTYIELIDKTTYLNHYYFITLVSFLLIWMPAHRYFSLDSRKKPGIIVEQIPIWMLWLIKIQIFFVYFFAGLAKINSDWLLKAQPLKIWLNSKGDTFLIGPLLQMDWVAYVFSWSSCLFDLLIGFFLIYASTRKIAYVFVLVFHILTSILFPEIGVFPYMMIFLTWVYFSEEFHLTLIQKIKRVLRLKSIKETQPKTERPSLNFKRPILCFAIIFVVFQAFMPMRYVLYPGHLFWTEQGYRFSWRVMLMEKAGTCFFYVSDQDSKGEIEIINSKYLTKSQEKQMSTQPDMILQFAKIIEADYLKKGFVDPKVRVEAYVTLNGSGSQKFIDPSVDLTEQQENFTHKTWIQPFHK